MNINERLYVKEKTIADIVPPFQEVEVYAICSEKTKMDISYFSVTHNSLDEVEQICSEMNGQLQVAIGREVYDD